MPEYYKGVQIRDYNTDCIHLLDDVPDKYLRNLYSLSFFNINPYGIGGYYFYSKTIYIFQGCRMDYLIHELAHHCQREKGDNLYQLMSHKGHFEECYYEIKESVEGGK